MSELWDELRRSTQARIGLGRAGDGLPTERLLEFRVAHAAARDAVHEPLDGGPFVAAVAGVGLGAPAVVRSRVRDRGEYLRRPDLGRVPESLDPVARSDADIGIVLADGLSPRALTDHGVPLLGALAEALSDRHRIAPPVVATGARVALGDHIGAALGVRTVIVVIGERPGLSVADSLGIYLTHGPRPGCSDADRNCVSNIHPPAGLGYRDAARVVSALVDGAHRLGRSGVALKDTSRAHPLASPPTIGEL